MEMATNDENARDHQQVDEESNENEENLPTAAQSPDIDQLVAQALREAIANQTAANQRIGIASNDVIIPDRVIHDNESKDGDNDEESTSTSENKIYGIGRRFTCVAVLACLFAITAVSVGVIARNGGSSEKEAPPDQDSIAPSNFPSFSVAPSMSLSPSSAPTPFPTLSALASFGEMLEPGTDVFDLDQESPEYQALEWIASHNDPMELTAEKTTELLERYALAVLYFSTDGRRWTRNSFWLSATVHHCLWELVQCDRDQVVTSLLLEQNGLVGTLPAQIRFLRNVQTLHIENGGGNLYGQLPSDVRGMTSLTSLQLWRIQLSNTLPVELGHLSRLQNLLVSEGAFTGPIPSNTFAGMVDLRRLILDTPGIVEGPIPSSLYALSNLANLDINNVGFTGSISSEIGFNTGLTSLQIWTTPMSGTLPSELGKLTQLQNILLGYSDFSGSIPTEFAGLSNLRRMIFDSILVEGPIPSKISELPNLETLDFQNLQLSGTIPTEIGLLTRSLTRLRLRDCGLSGSLPSEIGLLTSLTFLDLKLNNFSSDIPPEILNLPVCQRSTYDWSMRYLPTVSSILMLDVQSFGGISCRIPFVPLERPPTNKNLTYMLLYYNDHKHLAHQIKAWKNFSKSTLDQIQFLIVDDGSTLGHTAADLFAANRELIQGLDILGVQN